VAAATRPTCAVATFAEAVQNILKQSPNVRAPLMHNGQGAPGPTDADDVGDEDDGPVARAAPDGADTQIASLRRTLHDLTDELRSERLRRAEFTAWKMGAVFCQLLTLLVALLGLMQIDQTDVFFKWMLGAALGQLLTITLLLADLRG